MRRKRSVAAVAAAVAVLAGVGTASAFAPHRAQGVKVHGRWTVVVRSRSGKVMRVRRFENSLQTRGAEMLVDLLGRQVTPGRWAIELDAANSTSSHPCTLGAAFCWFTTEPSNQFDLGNPTTKNLTVTTQVTNAAVLTLKGNVTVDVDASIFRVASLLGGCAKSTPMASCTNATPALFTAANVTPVPVSKGQQVAVTVEFTFS